MGAIVLLCISYAMLSVVIIKKSTFFATKLVAFKLKQNENLASDEEMLKKCEVSISVVGYALLGISMVILISLLLFNLIVL